MIKPIKTTKVNWDADMPTLQRKINELVSVLNMFLEEGQSSTIEDTTEDFGKDYQDNEQQVLKEIREYSEYYDNTGTPADHRILIWQKMLK